MIEDSPNNVSAFTGAVSGFGGANHTNHKQFIDLTSVSFTSGQIIFSYVSAAANAAARCSCRAAAQWWRRST